MATREEILAEAYRRAAASTTPTSPEAELYKAAQTAGWSDAQLDQYMGFEPGASAAWVQQNAGKYGVAAAQGNSNNNTVTNTPVQAPVTQVSTGGPLAGGTPQSTPAAVAPLAQEQQAWIIAEANRRATANNTGVQAEIAAEVRKGGGSLADAEIMMGYPAGYLSGGTQTPAAPLADPNAPFTQDQNTWIMQEAQRRATANNTTVNAELIKEAAKTGKTPADVERMMGMAAGSLTTPAAGADTRNPLAGTGTVARFTNEEIRWITNEASNRATANGTSIGIELAKEATKNGRSLADTEVMMGYPPGTLTGNINQGNNNTAVPGGTNTPLVPGAPLGPRFTAAQVAQPDYYRNLFGKEWGNTHPGAVQNPVVTPVVPDVPVVTDTNEIVGNDRGGDGGGTVGGGGVPTGPIGAVADDSNDRLGDNGAYTSPVDNAYDRVPVAGTDLGPLGGGGGNDVATTSPVDNAYDRVPVSGTELGPLATDLGPLGDVGSAGYAVGVNDYGPNAMDYGGPLAGSPGADGGGYSVGGVDYGNDAMDYGGGGDGGGNGGK